MEEVKGFLRSRSVVNLTIVIINVAVFLVLEFQGNTEDAHYLLRYGASYAPWIYENKEYYRLFTCMFLHFGLNHLFNNMLVLIFLGDILEKTVGKVRYLLIYLLGGLGSSYLSYFLELQQQEMHISAGASGAVFAVVGALLYIVLVNRGRMRELSGRRLMLMAGLSIFQGFTSVGIDNAAHVGGFIGGLVLAVILYRRPKEV